MSAGPADDLAVGPVAAAARKRTP
ncbi:MAG: hypothetical protein QOE51_4522, partial [Actinoplanes sp.]|nr:hypothetical protein [Actinoplanes sp.]